MNRYICHPNGNDLNGGGFDFSSYSGTWAQWHNNFAALVVQANCAVGNNGSGKIRITSQGSTDFANVPEFVIMHCDFTAIYDDGRYVVLSVGNDYIDIGVDYVSDTTVTVRVGGAILSPKEACALGYSTSLNEVLFPCNQTTQTINEVDGSDNSVTLQTEGSTIIMYGVNDTTGVLLEFDDLWPVIQAKTGTTWSSGTILFHMQDGVTSGTTLECYFNCDKINFDGNYLTPVVLQLGDSQSDKIFVKIGDIEVYNSKSDGTGMLVNAYLSNSVADETIYYVNTIKISDCGTGLSPGSRNWPPIKKYIWVDNCSVFGVTFSLCYYSAYLQGYGSKFIFSNNAIAIYYYRHSKLWISPSLFINNDVDFYCKKYSSTFAFYVARNCLFYNDATGGKIFSTDDDGTYVTAEFENCVLGKLTDSTDNSRWNGIVPTLKNCRYINSDPLMDKDSDPPDYRLNPSSDAFEDCYDWNDWIQHITAVGVAEPASGGGSGGVSASRIFGGL